MDAISANWPLHLAVYLDYLVYQVEWVTGANGYVRWMLDGHVLFEVTAETFSNVPQDAGNKNPTKLMIEEPMSLILNVALSRSWGTTPPNPGQPCRGDGSNAEDARICNEFPILMKIDYICLYQDQADDLDGDNYMQVGCDPKSHPTKEWINGHLDEYQDAENPAVGVAGKAFCKVDDDCTVMRDHDRGLALLKTGSCVKNRCQCLHPQSWGGPRCTVALAEIESSSSRRVAMRVYGPPMAIALGVARLTVVVTFLSVWYSLRTMNKQAEIALRAVRDKNDSTTSTVAAAAGESPLRESLYFQQQLQFPDPQRRSSKGNYYHQNFI